MGTIEDVYEDVEADVSEEEFREAVEAKVEQMGGLADEETAAMLVAHELGGGEANTIADITSGMSEVRFVAKVVSIGELRTFEREDDEGQVLNLDVADETGRVRVALWDEDATAGTEEIENGQVLRIKGRPKEGYNGLEVSATRVEGDPDAEVDVTVGEEDTVSGLSLGQSDVTLQGRVLAVEPVRTFERDDGSEGRVSNVVLGDETGRVRVTLWDEQADRVEELEAGKSVELVDGYVRDRDGTLEVHVGSRGAIEEIDKDVTYVPSTTPIAELEIGETVDIAGVVRSTDPKRTFERDDESEGQVRNVRVQDRTDDIRVALWGEKADIDIGPGDEVLFADVEIQDGWQDDLEASAGWRSTVSRLEDGTTASAPATDAAVSEESTDANGDGTLASFVDSDNDTSETGDSALASETGASTDSTDTTDSGTETSAADAAATEVREFTGTVVQTGDPVMLDDGSETLTVITDADVRLGQEVTVRGRMREDKLDAEDVF